MVVEKKQVKKQHHKERRRRRRRRMNERMFHDDGEKTPTKIPTKTKMTTSDKD